MRFRLNSPGKFSITIALVVVVLIVASFFIGQYSSSSTTPHKDHPRQAKTPDKEEIWTCSMHPQIQQPKPGKCPLCGMDLIPLESSEKKDKNPRKLRLSPRAAKIAEIRVMPVLRKFVDTEIRLVGKVEYDETRRKIIASRVPGRLDRLYVDYTGIPVNKGDHLVYIYSPTLLTAQQELLQALKTREKLKHSKLKTISRTAEQTVVSAREKLRLLGLSIGQIKRIERRGTSNEHMTIYSPLKGIVIHKNATEGMYVKTGYPIYTVADLSRVWVFLDAYESDIAWLRYGQQVEFETRAYPGQRFQGKIAFISPTLDSKTRTVKVRVNVDNKAGLLKPDMFVKAVVHSKVAMGGKIMDPELAGKWMCPMHPEILQSKPGKCSSCHMPLVKTESLGYISTDEKASAPLVIPATAPLITGKRAVVYVFHGESDSPVYEGREIELGSRAGEFFIVQSGLKDGEMVVTNGNFKIDSALQILGRPSMMNPETDGMQHQDMTKKTQSKCPVMGGEINKEHFIDYQGHRIYFCCPGCDVLFLKEPEVYLKKMKHKGIALEKISPGKLNPGPEMIDPLFSNYFSLHKALANDQLKSARNVLKKLHLLLSKLDSSAVQELIAQIHSDEKAQASITEIREKFALVSETFNATLTNREFRLSYPVYQFRCSMAFDNRGAIWLQKNKNTANPYYGHSMPLCGELKHTYEKDSRDEH